MQMFLNVLYRCTISNFKIEKLVVDIQRLPISKSLDLTWLTLSKRKTSSHFSLHTQSLIIVWVQEKSFANVERSFLCHRLYNNNLINEKAYQSTKNPQCHFYVIETYLIIQWRFKYRCFWQEVVFLKKSYNCTLCPCDRVYILSQDYREARIKN